METQDRQCSSCKHFKPIGDFYNTDTDLTETACKTCAGCRDKSKKSRERSPHKRSLQSFPLLAPANTLRETDAQDKQCSGCNRLSLSATSTVYKKQPPDFTKDALKMCARCRDSKSKRRVKPATCSGKKLRQIAPAPSSSSNVHRAVERISEIIARETLDYHVVVCTPANQDPRCRRYLVELICRPMVDVHGSEATVDHDAFFSSLLLT
jgi:hypothetical protein